MALRILIVASEAVPFVKVGGLADVAGSLPRHLARLGHEVKLVLPCYDLVDPTHLEVALDSLGVPMGGGTEWCRLLRAAGPDGVEVLFVERHDLFSRAGVYGEQGQGYADNGRRFVFFSRAALQAAIDLRFRPDVVHCHDWMTAVAAAYLKYHLGGHPTLGATGSLLTIHNIGPAYQGHCGRDVLAYSGLPAHAFHRDRFEDHDGVNLLKGGIALADILNTVSPTYAREILTPLGGGGLDGHLRLRQHDLHGVLNGMDYEQWSPETDELLPARYSAADLSGKARCKRHLQEAFGLDPDPAAPLAGCVSRLDFQKGIDLIAAAASELVAAGAQIVLLGSGEPGLAAHWRELALAHPGRVGANIGFDNRLAHWITAGADLFLMPSRWEPCGLAQLQSLRYGTLPVVRATGGLDDTVEAYDPATGAGTGFKFAALEAAALRDAVLSAMGIYRRQPERWRNLQVRAMARRFTWDQAAERYVQLYEWAIAKRRVWR